MDWIGLSTVLRPRQHSIGYMGLGDGSGLVSSRAYYPVVL